MRVLLSIHSGAGIGDIVALTGCAQALVEDYGAEVHVQCRSKGWDYCKRNPFIAGFGWPVNGEGMDFVVDTAITDTERRTFPGHRPEMAGAKSRTEFMADFAAHVTGKPVRATVPTYAVPENERAWALEWFRAAQVDPTKAIGFQPTATKQWRNWPRPLAKRLAALISANGYAPIVFHQRAHEIRSIPGHPFVADALWKVGAALSLLPLFVGVDSGLFHLAAAVGTPAIGLFGGTSGQALGRSYPRATYIQGDAKGFRLSVRHVCNGPCHKTARLGFYKQTCWYLGCEAMWKIAPEAVWEHVRGRLHV